MAFKFVRGLGPSHSKKKNYNILTGQTKPQLQSADPTLNSVPAAVDAAAYARPNYSGAQMLPHASPGVLASGPAKWRPITERVAFN